MHLSSLVAAVVLASTSLPGAVAAGPAAAAARRSASPTVRPWPCATGTHQFALQAIGQPSPPPYTGENTTRYSGSYLGVLKNGTAPALRPINKERPLWYLKGQTLYVAPATTSFGKKLAGAPVIETGYATDGSDPKYVWYWQNWLFNTTAVNCPNCTAVTCSVQAQAGAPDGILGCQNAAGYNEEWVALPYQADAAVGLWQSAAQLFGPPSPGGEILWKIVPSCLLKS